MDLDKFVVEISKREELYDPSHVNYKDTELKNNAYEEIGAMFDLSGK